MKKYLYFQVPVTGASELVHPRYSGMKIFSHIWVICQVIYEEKFPLLIMYEEVFLIHDFPTCCILLYT